MRLIVDEMPKDTLDCPFGKIISSLYFNRIEQTKCALADGGPCELKDGKCPWLKRLANNDESFEELYQSLLEDTCYTNAMKKLLEWPSPNLEVGYSNEKE